ncbi:hypothetical protein R82526_03609 [Ralstonia mannitolilytica]|uniref:hypothetical protein n=1 Tax=Ralstonia mannitolilytica TaxID=105219 RepID=UPI0028F68B58|nr:hypothetical protein [Ralstonia mannitolilytica]CAJ0691177.1 hypothetical protein R82526_03609 [Ralstonia mannitolilytica]
MAIDKLNSLQFLLFRSDYFQEFGDRDGVYVDRVPWELRQRLLRWTWPTTDRDQYFFQHEGRDVITREGWEAFVRWVCCAMDRQLGAEGEATGTIDGFIHALDGKPQPGKPMSLADMDEIAAAGWAGQLDPSVTITHDSEQLIAHLSGGRVVRHHDAVALAELLLAAGITVDDVKMPDWHEGDSAPSIGQRIAIFQRMRQGAVKSVRLSGDALGSLAGTDEIIECGDRAAYVALLHAIIEQPGGPIAERVRLLYERVQHRVADPEFAAWPQYQAAYWLVVAMGQFRSAGEDKT